MVHLAEVRRGRGFGLGGGFGCTSVGNWQIYQIGVECEKITASASSSSCSSVVNHRPSFKQQQREGDGGEGRGGKATCIRLCPCPASPAPLPLSLPLPYPLTMTLTPRSWNRRVASAYMSAYLSPALPLPPSLPRPTPLTMTLTPRSHPPVSTHCPSYPLFLSCPLSPPCPLPAP